MDARKILIAEGSEDFRLALAEALQGVYYVRCCQDGQEALALLKSYNPDILVLDLMLPGMDGISLLHEAAESGSCPMVLATGKFYSDYMTEALAQLGVEYVLTKPCDLRSTIARIHDLSHRIRRPLFSHPDPRNQISSLLISLGIPVNLRGYSYLREAVLLIARNRHQSITKELYPTIARIFDNRVDGQNVERAIRNSITKAWINRDDRFWQMYFSPDHDGSVPKPSNSQFIHALADSLHLQESINAG